MVVRKMNIATLFNVQGLTAVITGGSGQLGRVMAQGLALEGAQVAVVSRSAETSAMVAGAINTDGGKAIGIACDVMDRAALERTVEQVTGTFGPVDILINAAGGNQPRATTSAELTFFDLDAQALEQVFGLNFTGTLQSCQVFGRGMAERGQGGIVNVTSLTGFLPPPPLPPYLSPKPPPAKLSHCSTT